MDAIFHRTSIRQFQDRPVEEDKIELLLRAAMQAPSAVNQQPWEFYVVRSPQVIAQLSAATPYAGCAKNAPLVIVIAYREGTVAPSFREIDCAIATENLMLEADSLGLGTVMMGVAPMEASMHAVGEILHLPEYLRAFTIVPVGYPAKENPQKDRYDTARIHFVD